MMKRHHDHRSVSEQVNPDLEEAEREEMKLERMGLTPDWIIEVCAPLLQLSEKASSVLVTSAQRRACLCQADAAHSLLH